MSSTGAADAGAPGGALACLAAAERRLLVRAPAPRDGLAAMKAVLTDQRFSDPDWIFERKLDGIRCLAAKADGQVRLRSRNQLSLNDRYPEVVRALADDAAGEFVLDGEVVAFQGARTSFAALSRRGREPVAVYLYVFDILHLDGHDTRRLPLRARKRLLRRAVSFHGPLRLTPYRRGDGEKLFQQACRQGWEGLIAKRADSPYSSSRSRDWLKFKCSAEQELVIGGYTAPRGSRTHLGALLVGHYRGGSLHYAGKVGTGFDREALADLGRRLAPLRCECSPFADHAPGRDTTWVKPTLVAQIAFSEWTRDGRLRHPRYLGLREDKAARSVVREDVGGR